jgi:RimJ/RimL family protein N-acetyltransferase
VTEQVTLRPVDEDDLAILERLTQDPEVTGEFEWSGWYDLRSLRRDWAENGLVGAEGGVLMVVRGPEVLGAVNWQRRETTPVSHCWEVGIELLPEARGQGHGTQAQRLLVRYLLAHTTVHRIEAVTEIGNVGEQRALEKAGFTREGVLRGLCWRDGAWRDSVLYSILRTDRPA